MHVIDLAKVRGREAALALRALADIAEKGEIEAVMYVCRFGAHDHRAGAAGAYRRNPGEALQAIFLLERLVSKSQHLG
jgi:hypothetical protein